MNVNSNFTNNRKILATIQVLFNRGMVDQTVYIHAMEYYSAMKKNGLLIHPTSSTSLMEFRSTMLNE